MIDTQQYKDQYTGDGATVEWDFTKPYNRPQDINVFVIERSTGEKTQIGSTYFTAVETTAGDAKVVRITYPLLGGTPLSSDYDILLQRITPITQIESSQNVFFKSSDVEDIADKLTMIAQENRGLAASDSAGLIQIATQAEVDEGANDSKAVTPKTLKTKIDNDLSEKQDKLTAGTGITITDNVISSTSSGVPWGNITGTLSEQEDLKTVLDAKQSVDNLVTAIGPSSTNAEYPSAKCVYDAISQSGGGTPTLTWYAGNTGTTLTIADTSTSSLVKIYKNGILLQPTDDYSISGTTLTLVTALIATDKITTEIY